MKPRGSLFFDIETRSADLLYTLPPEEFVRLIGYAWNDGDVQITSSLAEIREQILKARWIVGHNIHSFDLPAIFGIKSNIPMRLADEGRIFDTWTHAVLANPSPYQYTNRHGKSVLSKKPEQMMRWFGLDEQAHQLGVAGKTHDLGTLVLEWGDEDLPKKERIADGLAKIPLDNPKYVEYLKGDVVAGREVARALLKKMPLNAYALREQRIESRKAAISSNGWRVNALAAQARVDQLKVKRDEIMKMMVEKYDFPTEGKAPWSSKAGKEAILKALADAGVTEGTRPGWPRTGAGALQLGGEVLVEITEGTEAEELGKALAELKGQRSLAELALKSMHSDGFVHPQITMLQASGRWSTTDPGLTVWTSHGPNAVEKEYFIADNDNEALLEIDLSNADARIVAWNSGDTKYAERFLPGADGHLINAWAAWGKDVVGTDKKNPITAEFRQLAKPGGHGWGYRIGPAKLAATWKKPFIEAKRFLDNMNKTFRGVVKWQEYVTEFAQKNGYVMNHWGRKMRVEPGREYTQGPALVGQSGTRELMCDFLLAIPHAAVRTIKASVHDAYVFSVKKDQFEEIRDYLVSKMSVHLPAPPGGQDMSFPATPGPAAENWYQASHD